MKTIMFKATLWSNLFVGLLHLSAFAALIIMDYSFEPSGFRLIHWYLQPAFCVVLIVTSIRQSGNEKLNKYSRIAAVFGISFMAIYDSAHAVTHPSYADDVFQWAALVFFVGWTFLNVFAAVTRPVTGETGSASLPGR
jgi:hypothetical protein